MALGILAASLLAVVTFARLAAADSLEVRVSALEISAVDLFRVVTGYQAEVAALTAKNNRLTAQQAALAGHVANVNATVTALELKVGRHTHDETGDLIWWQRFRG